MRGGKWNRDEMERNDSPGFPRARGEVTITLLEVSLNEGFPRARVKCRLAKYRNFGICRFSTCAG